jgi:uncharacterized protein with PhoU and TrkA domain
MLLEKSEVSIERVVVDEDRKQKEDVEEVNLNANDHMLVACIRRGTGLA